MPNLCECGCGGLTNKRFVRGHNVRRENWTDLYSEVPGPLPTPCWRWNGALDTRGYGQLWRPGNRTIRAHRYIYEMHRGLLNADLELDHLCRTPACVNPAHLDPVTHADNMRRGNSTKLTVEQVREIKARIEAGEGNHTIAADFGVTHTNICEIRAGRTWKGV